MRPDWREPLATAYERAADYLAELPARRVGPVASPVDLRRALGGPLPEEPTDASAVVRALADAVEPGLVATGSARYFGFVVGGATPAALAADWLTSAWDQNAFTHVAAPAASVVEEVAGAWLADLLGLPGGVSVGFVTGAQAANTTALAAARHEVLRRAGWDVEADGLWAAPPVRILVGAEKHATIERSLRLLGIGLAAAEQVRTDGQGRMRPDALAELLGEGSGPVIVCAQAGNVNTGAVDPLDQICQITHAVGNAWVHVDGAFGLWAAASPATRPLVRGLGLADSWATDAHKWLNVPYDSGLVFCAHPAAHRAAMSARAAYLTHGTGEVRDAMDHNPEASRRARGIPVWAALRSLGRSGVADLVERCCRLARLFAERLAADPDVEVLNEVMLNQVLVRFRDPSGDHDGLTRRVVQAVQADGTCWLGGTDWHGQAAMRISVSNYSTREHDVERSVSAILACRDRVLSAEPPTAAQSAAATRATNGGAGGGAGLG